MNIIPEWLSKLNEEQKVAVETTEGPLLVLSGAGTGKTRVLTSRIAYIISKGLALPWQILAVTFTNKAANEMKNRVKGIIGNGADSLWIGTFHSIGLKILKRYTELVGLKPNFIIFDENDQKIAVFRPKSLTTPSKVSILGGKINKSLFSVTPRVYSNNKKG